MPADDPRRVVQGPGRQRQRGTVEKQRKPLVVEVSESWSTSSLTGGFLTPDSDTPHLHQTVTNHYELDGISSVATVIDTPT